MSRNSGHYNKNSRKGGLHKDSKFRSDGPPSAPDKLWIYGKHSAEAALKNKKRKIFQVMVTQNCWNLFKDILPTHAEVTDDRKISHTVGQDAVHQGIAVLVSGLNDGNLDKVELGNLVVVLDQVTDPHNVGAVMRSASAFGASTVINTFRNSPPEGGVLAKSASGAMEMVNYIRVRNLANSITHLKEHGFFVAGLDADAEQDISTVSSHKKIALVLGAEGKGLREKTREFCDLLVKIPIRSEQESLNISNAAAIALYEAAKKI
jgi:23S rRNA (guanosine2251-2'-O)-methyltransferase